MKKKAEDEDLNVEVFHVAPHKEFRHVVTV